MVRDTGIGIAPELLPHVFETFMQADDSLARSRGGLGLGLALVKGLVELHGGEVCAYSAGPGRGAEFTFLLPQVQSFAPLEEACGPEVRAGKCLRVLVVEDNRDAAETLGDLLELFGHEVAIAYSGNAALPAARQFRPDVVMCDLGLPGIDGYEVASALRQDPTTSSVHLIALTGYGQEEDQRRTHEAGFDRHLTKPVDPAAIERLLAAAAFSL
jgi:CheY-like chemotaxis protein